MYRKLVYMVSAEVRPAVLGPGQMRGLRGETQVLDPMEARVHGELESLHKQSGGQDRRILRAAF
jgi:putative colanic acid biosynthesis UDP-glucose lipid carrier transferase